MPETGHPQDDLRYLELRDRLRATLVLFGGVAAAVIITLWSKEQIRPIDPSGATVNSLRGVVGWPKRVDALATLDGALRFSPQHELRGLVFEGVKPDGTLDLTVAGSAAKYVFQSGPKQSRRLTFAKVGSAAVCPKQVVRLRRAGLSAEGVRADASCPADLGSPLPLPTCGPKEIWKRALAQGAVKDGVARLDYYRATSGPVWRMAIPNTSFVLHLSGDCTRELSRSEASGRLP